VLFASPAYQSGTMLVVLTFDEADQSTVDSSCCGEPSGPNVTLPGVGGAGGGQTGAVVFNPRYVKAGSVDSTGAYNHYSALRTYEDLLGLTTGGADGLGHLGFASSPGLVPFGTDVFNRA